MKSFKNIVLLACCIALTYSGFSQSETDTGYVVKCEINRNFPPLSMTKEKLSEASSIADLNRYFDPNWIGEYISVEVVTLHEGIKRTAKSKDGVLSFEQKENMRLADNHAITSVFIDYMPNNSLAHNTPKEFDFDFTIDAQVDATFTGGKNAMKAYLDETIMKKTDKSLLKEHGLSSTLFTVDTKGQITNVSIVESTGNEALDKLIYEAVCNMPTWTPAQFSDKTKVEQEFALTLGDHRSCAINSININRKL